MSTSNRCYSLPPTAVNVLLMLEDIAHYNVCQMSHLGTSQGSPHVFTLFNSSAVPPISTVDYGRRIAKYSKCGEEYVVAAVALMLRYQKQFFQQERTTDGQRQQSPTDPPPVGTVAPIMPLNTHRLLLTASLVAAKLYSDVFFSNAYYAQLGGVTAKELRRLEVAFLTALDWRTSITAAEYDAVVNVANDLERQRQQQASTTSSSASPSAAQSHHLLPFRSPRALGCPCPTHTSLRTCSRSPLSFTHLANDHGTLGSTLSISPHLSDSFLSPSAQSQCSSSGQALSAHVIMLTGSPTPASLNDSTLQQLETLPFAARSNSHPCENLRAAFAAGLYIHASMRFHFQHMQVYSIGSYSDDSTTIIKDSERHSAFNAKN